MVPHCCIYICALQTVIIYVRFSNIHPKEKILLIGQHDTNRYEYVQLTVLVPEGDKSEECMIPDMQKVAATRPLVAEIFPDCRRIKAGIALNLRKILA